MSRCALLCAMLLALTASAWDWPPIQNQPKVNYYEWKAEELAGRAMDGSTTVGQWSYKPQTQVRLLPVQPEFYLRPVATISDRGGNHVAVGVSDLGELAIAAGTGGDSPRSAEPATKEAISGDVRDSDGPGYPRSDSLARGVDTWNNPEDAVATWVHRDLHGGLTASQTRYYWWDPHYIASNDWPIGTVLVISDVFTGVVVDRGLMGPSHIDLSEAAFQRLAALDQGVVEVTVRESR